MNKLLIILIVLIGSIQSINGQYISDNSLGLRFGDNDGLGGELTYQRKMTQQSRIELNLGYRNHKSYDAFKFTGIYQWVWTIDERLNWYVGLGGGLGSWSYSKGLNNNDDGLFINADGNIGIEYNFKSPILISLDFRPEFEVLGNYGRDPDLDIAMSFRYEF